MAWGYIRVLIFTTAFLVGLLLFGSGGSSADSKTSAALAARQATEVKCGSNTVLIRASRGQMVTHGHLTGM
jgi:hypothetical protein